MAIQEALKRQEPQAKFGMRTTLEFDLERYRSRMAHCLGGTTEANRVFFDALNYAYHLHAGQRRKSGAPYISHPCAVAEILLRELKLQDPILLASALLHDVVEDIPSVTIRDIDRKFGGRVAELVDGCTKMTRYHLDRATLKDLTHSKIFLSASRRLGVLVIKLTDRLHNLRTLHFLKQSKRQRIAQETVEVYAPIAAILNISTLKRELYHLALSHLYPRKSKKILNLTKGLLNSPEVLEIEAALKEALAGARNEVTIRPRIKGLGSYYNALKRTLSLVNAENRVDFTIIIGDEDIPACYQTLGVVNALFPPVPRTIRDFIAKPKSNNYESIHARSNIKGLNYLFKIRTPSMDYKATYGILSDWDSHKQLADEHWQEISELFRNIGEYSGAGPRRKDLLRLSESEDVFVYTPVGDIHYFPKGSVVLDFAYKIHSELGEHCRGALVNDTPVGPAHRLMDGDVVEILTSQSSLEVDPALEELCKTPKARTSLNKRLQQKRLKYAQMIGRQILSQEVQQHRLPLNILEGEQARLVMEVLNVRDLPDLYAHIGQDRLSPHLFLYYFTGDGLSESHHNVKPTPLAALPNEQNAILMDELDNAVHKFARCCSPYPGEPDLVATLSERGVSIHQQDCHELKRHGISLHELLIVTWNLESRWPSPLIFRINVRHETISSLFAALAKVPSHLQIEKLENITDSHGQRFVQMTVTLHDLLEARGLFESLPAAQTTVEWYGRQDWWLGE